MAGSRLGAREPVMGGEAQRDGLRDGRRRHAAAYAPGAC